MLRVGPRGRREAAQVDPGRAVRAVRQSNQGRPKPHLFQSSRSLGPGAPTGAAGRGEKQPLGGKAQERAQPRADITAPRPHTQTANAGAVLHCDQNLRGDVTSRHAQSRKNQLLHEPAWGGALRTHSPEAKGRTCACALQSPPNPHLPPRRAGAPQTTQGSLRGCGVPPNTSPRISVNS